MSEKETAVVELTKNKGIYVMQYTTKNPMLIIEDYERKYGYRPERGHLMVMERNGILTPYITKSGWSQIANSKKISTKIAVEKIGKGYAFMKCTAVLPDGTSHEAIGYSDTTEPGKENQSKCLAMAQTRARNKALEYATETTECSWEEVESPEMAKRSRDITEMVQETLTVCPECKKHGWSKLQKRCLECGITHEAIVEGRA